MTTLITPTVNINGTAALELISTRVAAHDAIGGAIEALKAITPNGRDYPGDADRCTADRQIHYARIAQLKALADDLYTEALAIQRQQKD
jgi:hypothetical protein